MLVLNRKDGEEIFINQGEIQIKVIFTEMGHVALGIQAPPHIDIHRKEIFLRNQEKNKS